MAMQARLSLLPEGAQQISPKLAFVRRDGRITFYNGADPVYVISEDDDFGFRVALGMFSDRGLATPTALARAFECDPSTAFRNRKKIREGGIEALLPKKRPGPRGASKLKDETVEEAQRLLDEGLNNSEVGRRVGISEGAIRKAIQRGLLKAKPRKKGRTKARDLKRPRERAQEDVRSAAGVAVKRHEERILASVGKLREAAPEFVAAEAVEKAGVLLAIPAIRDTGLFAVGNKVYGRLKNGFYGLRSILLTFAFMALLRIKTIEQLSRYAPGELGHLLGLDRVPEVKTLRRKLREMGAKGRAWKFSSELTQRWVTDAPERMDFLFIDGHVRAYTGRKHQLPKTRVPRRGLCMPATTDMWVNDEKAEPLLFVTTEANGGLLSTLNEEILPEVRRLAGKERRVTLVFDREGWSPQTFQVWEKKKFDVLTYRKLKYVPWPEECFYQVDVEVSGKQRTYRLGQRSVRIFNEKRTKKGKVTRREFWMREVRCLCEDGHQTSVLTTRQDLDIETVALRMFSRWRQENFFRYMRHEFDLDHLPTYAVEPADPERPVKNPERKKREKAHEKLKADLAKLEREYGAKALVNQEGKRGAKRGSKTVEAKAAQKILELRGQIEQLKQEIKATPKRVPVKEVVGGADKVVRLEQQRKVIADSIKLVAYRAETALLNILEPFLNRHREEGRDFLESVFKARADVIPDELNNELVVRYYPLSNHRSNVALCALCEMMNQRKARFPGTKLQLTFVAPPLQEKSTGGQEP